MFKSLKNKISRAILGEQIRDWGVVYENRSGFFKERISLGLYQKDRQLILCLTYRYTSRISFNSYTFAIPVFDLDFFVATLRANYDQLCSLARLPAAAIRASDRLPFAQRLMIKIFFGLKGSKLLLDHRNPSTDETEFRFNGFITRKSVVKVLIQSDMDISQNEGHVISGDGLDAILCALSEYLRTGAERPRRSA